MADRSRIGFIMGDADWVCPYCEGESGNPRHGIPCSAHACRQAHHEVREKRARDEGTVPVVRGATVGGMLTPQNCHEIKKVIGHAYQDVREMEAYERRNGVDWENEDIIYQVRGKFKEDDNDEGVMDTRWVKLSDLIEHVTDQTKLDRELDGYAGSLKAKAKGAREALRRGR